jgi:hypothetical protein
MFPYPSSLHNFVFAGDWGTAKKVLINPSSNLTPILASLQAITLVTPPYPGRFIIFTKPNVPTASNPQRSRLPLAAYLTTLSIPQIMWRQMVGQ